MQFKRILCFLKSCIICLSVSWNSSKLYTIIRLSSNIIAPIISIIVLYVSKTIINVLSGQTQIVNKKGYIVFILFMFISMGLLSKLISKIKEYVYSMHNELLTKYVIINMMNKSINADLSFFDSPKYYNDFESARRDSFSFNNIVWNLIDGIGLFITFGTTIVVVGQLNIILALIIICAIIPSAILQQKYTKLIYNWQLSKVKDERKMNYINNIVSSRNFAQDIRLFNIGDMLLSRYKTIWGVFFSQRRRLIKKQTFLNTILAFLPDLCTLGFLIMIAFRIIDDRSTIGDYTLYSGLLAQMSGSLFAIVAVINRVYEDRMKIQNVQQFEKTQNLVLNIGTKSLDQFSSIEFKNVGFTYPGTEKDVLKNISFTVHEHERIGIVGLNGAGKTTIIKLILRFYDVTEGQILINGSDIREYEINSLRKCFSSFFQQVANYSFTLRENIQISDIDKNGTDEDVLKALEKSDATDFYKNLPKGLESYMTRAFEEDGIELSGGQHQKIALARTFYRDSKVIILDEPSASLDPEAEYRIFKSLDDLCENKTVILTSHRLSNITMMDKIIVIENGTVVEQGTHSELMANNNRYAQLFNYQASKYADIKTGS